MMLGLAPAWAAILATCWLGWQLLRQNGRILVRLDELQKRLDEMEFGEDEQPAVLLLGSDAPAFELPDLAGERKSLAQYRGQAVLLIFFNPACGFCRDMLPKLPALSPPQVEGRDGERTLTTLIISTGDAEANRQLFNERKLIYPVLLQKESEVAAAYKANGTPSGYLVSAEGKIASELAIGADALLALGSGVHAQLSTLAPQPNGNGDGRDHRFSSRSLVKSKIKRDGLKAGTTAPGFRLPRLDGHSELALSDFRGRPVLLVFSSPGCGPCSALAPKLEKFHREHPELQVIMISKGEPKDNRAKVKEHGLTFPVLLQQQWEISRRYAMFATPIAYLIDEAGIIVHDVAVGADGVLALLAEASGRSADFSPQRLPNNHTSGRSASLSPMPLGFQLSFRRDG